MRISEHGPLLEATVPASQLELSTRCHVPLSDFRHLTPLQTRPPEFGLYSLSLMSSR